MAFVRNLKSFEITFFFIFFFILFLPVADFGRTGKSFLLVNYNLLFRARGTGIGHVSLITPAYNSLDAVLPYFVINSPLCNTCPTL